MSVRYVWTIDLRLQPETPASFVDELRYLLGLTEDRPAAPELDHEWAALRPVEGEPVLERLNSAGFALQVTIHTIDDALYPLIQTVPAWLARWTEGHIGTVWEEQHPEPWLEVYAQDGYAYAGAPGEPIQPFDRAAPPFSSS